MCVSGSHYTFNNKTNVVWHGTSSEEENKRFRFIMSDDVQIPEFIGYTEKFQLLIWFFCFIFIFFVFCYASLLKLILVYMVQMIMILHSTYLSNHPHFCRTGIRTFGNPVRVRGFGSFYLKSQGQFNSAQGYEDLKNKTVRAFGSVWPSISLFIFSRYLSVQAIPP